MLQRTKQTTKTTKYTYAETIIYTKGYTQNKHNKLVYTKHGVTRDSSHRGQVRQAWTAVGLPPRYPWHTDGRTDIYRAMHSISRVWYHHHTDDSCFSGHYSVAIGDVTEGRANSSWCFGVYGAWKLRLTGSVQFTSSGRTNVAITVDCVTFLHPIMTNLH